MDPDNLLLYFDLDKSLNEKLYLFICNTDLSDSDKNKLLSLISEIILSTVNKKCPNY